MAGELVWCCFRLASRVQSAEAELTTAPQPHRGTGCGEVANDFHFNESEPILTMLIGLLSYTADGTAVRAAPPCFFSS